VTLNHSLHSRSARACQTLSAVILAFAMPVWAQEGSPGPALAGASAATVIQAVLSAPTLVDYEGTKIITAVRGEQAETVTVLESYKRFGKMRLEFLSPESTSGRLIVDDGASSWHYEPSLHVVVRGPSFFATPVRGDTTTILKRYDARILGNEQVIGRQTIVLELLPKTRRLTRRVWVDQATGVVLRTEERSQSGELLFSSFFSRISYSLNLPSALFRFHLPAGARIFSFYLSGDPVTDPQELSRQAKFMIRAPATLGGVYGFRSGTLARYGALMAVSMLYSDGVNVISLYETPSSQMAFPEVGTSLMMRAGRARWLDLGYFRVVMWESSGIRFAILGTLPAESLVAMAEEINATTSR
jgi:outer membrane lipoprotein-sorting protein